MNVMTYAETLEYLFTAMPSFQNIGGDAYKPGLERIAAFCELLGSPHLKYSVIHIAGTNGKGSTSHTLASVIQHSGYRTALFTSPHLRDFRERMRINGEMISQEEVVEFVATHKEAMERLQLSFFEMTAAMAFDFFARSGAEIAVIETGLGGRLDATNIVDPMISIITNIAIDHTKFLGTTLPSIATEKGGIIKPHTPIILGERGDEYTHVIEEIAKQRDSKMILAEDCFEVTAQTLKAKSQSITLQNRANKELSHIELDLAGSYQSQNIVTAYTAIDWLVRESHFEIPKEAIKRGLSEVISTTNLLGRWQTLSSSPHIICDTGHNAHGLKYVMEQLKITPHDKLIMVLGFANDKRLEEILPLFNIGAYFIFTRPKVDRAFDCEVVAQVARSLGYECETVAEVAEAVQRAKEIATKRDLIFVGGSNFVVAEVI